MNQIMIYDEARQFTQLDKWNGWWEITRVRGDLETSYWFFPGEWLPNLSFDVVR